MNDSVALSKNPRKGSFPDHRSERKLIPLVHAPLFGGVEFRLLTEIDLNS